jgi:hypothetical protein
MSEMSSWVLKGIDPALRDRAAEDAARLGVSLADYLTDVVLRSALVEQMSGQPEEEPAQYSPHGAPIIAPQGDGPESYAVRHRLRGLERRLNAAVHTLDDSMLDITTRLGEMEGLVSDTADGLVQQRQENEAAFTGVHMDVTVLGDNISALAAATTDRAAGFDQRLDAIEMIARNADEACAELAEEQHALKHAVASDFADFTTEITGRLHTTLAEVRHNAAEAAAEADAAIAHLIQEFRHAREMLDERLEESAADTRAHMHAAFADAAERLGSLAERVIANEHNAARTAEQLHARIIDTEDAAQTALEETAQSLRQADAALASDAVRRAHDQEAALENLRSTLRGEIAGLREDHGAAQARIGLLDSAFANHAGTLVETREALAQRISDGEAQVRAMLARAEADQNQRHNNASARIDAAERETAQLGKLIRAEVDRVESCTTAALSKLAGDISQGDSDLAAQIAQLRGQAQTETALLREGVAGALSRAQMLEAAVERVETTAGPLADRIAQIEAAFAGVDQTIADRVIDLENAVNSIDPSVAGRLADVEAAVEAQRHLAARVDAQQSFINDTGEQLQGMTRLLNRVAAQTGETAAKTEERVHAMEMALADIRLDHIAGVSAERDSAHDLVLTLQARVAEMETTQVNAIHTITTEIARFIEENDARLAALEGPRDTDRDLANAFEALRRRVEERIIGVEQRSVRMLEQVADTVSMIEERFVATQRDIAAVKSA